MDNKSDLSLYKPNPSVTQAFEVDEALPDNELIFELFGKLVLARKTQDLVFLSIGKMLKIVRDRKLFKLLDFDHFEQFLASEELSFSREKAYMYIRIYEHYSEFLGMDENIMRDLSIVRLSQMLPTLKKIPNKEDQLKKIEEMGALRYNDFVIEARKGTDNDKPTMHYSQEKGKWIVYYFEDKTELFNKGKFADSNVQE